MIFKDEIKKIKERINIILPYIHGNNENDTVATYSQAVRDLAEAISYLTKSEDPFNE